MHLTETQGKKVVLRTPTNTTLFQPKQCHSHFAALHAHVVLRTIIKKQHIPFSKQACRVRAVFYGTA